MRSKKSQIFFKMLSKNGAVWLRALMLKLWRNEVLMSTMSLYPSFSCKNLNFLDFKRKFSRNFAAGEEKFHQSTTHGLRSLKEWKVEFQILTSKIEFYVKFGFKKHLGVRQVRPRTTFIRLKNQHWPPIAHKSAISYVNGPKSMTNARALPIAHNTTSKKWYKHCAHLVSEERWTIYSVHVQNHQQQHEECTKSG